ncbi:MAG: homoserine O-acetyltransferase, partial [Alphaproteobacteria bacterium]
MVGFQVPDPPPSAVMEFDEPLMLQAGGRLDRPRLAWRTWGTLAPARNNAILLTHALTGDQFAAGRHPVTGEPGWWDFMIGPGRPLDPARDYLICVNCLGGSMGSTGPQTIDPRDGRPYGPRFPSISITDMVRVQLRLLERLEISRLRLAVGGSMGGMQALELLRLAPERVAAVAAFAIGARHHARQIAFHALQRRAIIDDPDWRGGDYLEAGCAPERGLRLARMIAHLSYRAPGEMEERFGRRLRLPGGEDLRSLPLYE